MEIYIYIVMKHLNLFEDFIGRLPEQGRFFEVYKNPISIKRMTSYIRGIITNEFM